jgi:aryl-alcohol dehydrogenase-like predicted oxidoreductase
MKRKKLGKSDIEVSAMTIGCWSFGGGEYWGDQSQKDTDNEKLRVIIYGKRR